MLTNIDYRTDYEMLLHHFRQLLNERIRNDKSLTQTGLGKMLQKSQNAINNWLTENKKYQCVPNAIDFLILCKVLNLSPEKFMDPGYSYQIEDINDNSIAEECVPESIPYIETSVYRELRNICYKCYYQNKLSIILAVNHNGTESAVREFRLVHKQFAVNVKDPESISNIKQQITEDFHVSVLPAFLEKQKLLFIIMNPELISPAGKDALLKEFYPDHALLFIYNQESAGDEFLKRNISKFYLNSISKYDIIEILNTLVPCITSEAISVVEAVSRGRIGTVMEIAEKIRGTYKGKSKISKKDVLDILFNQHREETAV